MQQNKLLTQFQGAMNLISMMPPSKLKKNLAGLVNIAPDIEDNLYEKEKVELPMQIKNLGQKQFLLTQLNRDGDSYRSPFENKYFPANEEDAYFPSQKYKEFQDMGNLLFTQYTKLYYGTQGIGSFYVLQNDQNPHKFTCGYFAKKNVPNEQGFEGQWNSFNIVDVEVKGENAHYSLESTVMLQMNIVKQTTGNIDLSGFMKNSKKIQKPLSGIKPQEVMEHHLVAVGQLIETLQTSIRQQMQAVYIARTRQIVFTTRYEQTREIEQNKYKLAQQLKSIRFSKE